MAAAIPNGMAAFEITPRSGSALEIQSQSELYHSWRVVRRRARRSSGHISLRAVGPVGVIESLMIEEVEDIQVELQIEALRDGEDFI